LGSIILFIPIQTAEILILTVLIPSAILKSTIRQETGFILTISWSNKPQKRLTFPDHLKVSILWKLIMGLKSTSEKLLLS